ncbi:glycosyltransferase family 2 protein [Planctomycetota bacterium]
MPNAKSQPRADEATILIVIVNYRTPQDTCNALKSLVPEVGRLPALKAIVTDNLSGDDSTQIIQEAITTNGWESWASVMPLDRNGGFAFGNNQAIRASLKSNRPDFVMLLNPDTLVEEHAIERLVSFLETNPEYGIAGSNVFLADGQPQTAARRLPTPMSEFEQQIRTGPFTRMLEQYVVSLPIATDQPTPCEWVSGAAMMVRTGVFEQIGMIDEAYFLYFEEVDFCARALDVGIKCAVVPDSKIIHLEGASTKISDTKQRRGKFWFESRRRYFTKRFGVWGLLKADVFWLTGRVLGRLIDLLRSRSSYASDPRRFAADLIIGDIKALATGKPMGEPPRISIDG